jgi:hypothetical protein
MKYEQQTSPLFQSAVSYDAIKLNCPQRIIREKKKIRKNNT